MAAPSKHNGDQMRALIRESESASKRLQNQVDRAVALADREIGFDESRVPSPESRELLSATPLPPLVPSPESRVPSFSPIFNMPGAQRTGMPSESPLGGGAVPPTPTPEAISVGSYTERIRAGWVPIMGLPGTPITSGFIRDLGEYNPKLEGLNAIWTYQEMRRGDGQVAGTLRACKLPILSAKWQILPLPATDRKKGQTELKADEVAHFIRENLFSGLEWQTHTGSWVTQDWKDVVRSALRMQDFGAAAYEEIATVDGDRIRMRRLADRQALTFYRWHTDPHSVDPSLPPFVYDDGETLYALEQWGYRSNRFEYVLLPAEKMCLFVQDQEGAGFWGIPLTRAMYPHWFVKKHLERIDAIACERNSLGVPMIMLPPNPSRQDVQTAQNWVTSLAAHEKTGLSLPNGAEFKIVGIEGRIREIIPSLEYHKKQIAFSVLAMFLELGQGQTGSGSHAVGGVQSDMFLLSVQTQADQVAARIRNGTIRRLVEWNFGPDAPVPLLIPANVQGRSIETMAETIHNLADCGALVFDIQGVNQNLGELGFKDLASSDLKPDQLVLGPRVTIEGVNDPATMAGKMPQQPNMDQQDSQDQPGGQTAKDKGQKQLSVLSGQLSVEKLARQPSNPLVAPRAHPSPFFREGDPEHLRHVYPHEQHVDFPAHWKALRGAEAKLAAMMRAWRPLAIRELANSMAKALLHGKPPKSVSLDGDGGGGLTKRLESILTPLYEFGQSEVRAEHGRLIEQARKAAGFGTRDSGLGAAETLALSPSSQPPGPKKGGLFAQISAQFFDEALENDATNAGISMLKKYGDAIGDQDAGTLADELFGAISENSDGFCDTIADMGARGDFRAGRDDAFDALAKELEKQGYKLQMIRVCAMEKASCASCRDANGQPLAPGEDITAIHEGPADTCECEAMESI
jgi:hypothetical protein